MWRFERWHISEGISPVNELDRRRKISNEGMLSAIHAGIFPENLFSPRSRLYKELQFCKEDGSLPERLLLLSMKNLREERKLTSLGIEPDRLLLNMSRTYSKDKLLQNWGISPDR
ncbi:hypothetical protein BT93_C1542 [Corymbia citriodora subsp. variegata]|nr:hypothetical protein BT93_C1542 [Corymbia citriodora subsp. variegata]